MVNIKLHKIDFSLLSELNPSQLIYSLSYKVEGDYYLIEATKDILENILDELSSILSEKGFDENSEPNYLGRKIEMLINSFLKLYD